MFTSRYLDAYFKFSSYYIQNYFLLQSTNGAEAFNNHHFGAKLMVIKD